METKNKTQTIGEKIDERVKNYVEIYEVLKEAGNPKPAKVMLSEAWLNEEFVTEKVMEELKKRYSEEAKKEGGQK